MPEEVYELTARENRLKTSLLDITRRMGKFDEQECGFAKMSMFYNRNCGRCVFYQGVKQSCQIIERVQGVIDPQSYCRFYLIPGFVEEEKKRLAQTEPIEPVIAR